MPKVVAIVGFGPGTATAVAQKFGAEGFSIALIGRNEERLAAGVSALQARGVTAFGFPADAGDPTSIRAAMQKIRSQIGPLAVLHWNAYGGLEAGDLLTAEPSAVHRVFDVAVFGLLAAVNEVLPDLSKSNGAILVSNGGIGDVSDFEDEAAASEGLMGLALSSAAKHKLTGLLSQRVRNDGVYVGEVMTFAYITDSPRSDGNSVAPTVVAEKLWQMYQARSETHAAIRPSKSSMLK
ncbi:MAG: SDR family NAD(P)-dependent oxidoreductase [Candidatus Eremiobacteraeota bacterium]|nr:SDR family NAD(P)-dependent oxidoreductase [Candidatus Eremiobacteraeota bacterium]